MKHTVWITLILVGVFFVSQIVGLAILNEAMPKKIDAQTGEYVLQNVTELPSGFERPQFESSWQAISFIITAVLIGTFALLILIKFRAFTAWKFWFFASVALCLNFSFYAGLHYFTSWKALISVISLTSAILLAYLKIYKPNFFIHNFTEIFVYGGLATIFVPIEFFNIYVATMILLLISVYDMIAVWQSKHMVKMAQFQTESKVFAGISIPYQIPKGGKAVEGKGRKVKEEIKSAILGGGDIGFPLLFAGVLMKSMSFAKVLIVPIVVSLALLLLLLMAKKDKFYPAMPFITIGCFVGYGILWLI